MQLNVIIKTNSFTFRIGYDRIVKMLIDAGADVNFKDNENRTPLFQASIYGNFLIYIFKNILKSVDVATGYEKVAKKLIHKGALVNSTDKSGMAAIHHAASGGECIFKTEIINNSVKNLQN